LSRRILITCWPFTGHLLPQMSIAMALRDRGHDVAFYSGEAVRATVEGEGFRFFGFQQVDQERAFAGMRAVDTGDRRSRPGRGRMLPILRDWLVESIPAQVSDLRSVIDAWQPDVLATDFSLWGPMLVLWETEPIPVAISYSFMGPLIPGPHAPAFGFGLPAPRGRAGRLAMQGLTALTEFAAIPMRRRVDVIRASYGLPPLGESVNRYTGRLPLYLVGNIPALDYGRSDLPESVHYVGNCIWYPDGPETRTWLERIPAGRRTILVSESTLAYGDPFLSRTAIAALADQPVEVIVTAGRDRDPTALGSARTAANVHVARWLNHGDVLPRCDCVVTVGGKATILAALQAGVPLVVVPTSWDKPDNARRVVAAGLGVRVAPRHCTPERLRRAVEHVLGEPRYRENARRIASLLSAAPGPSGAAALLEALGTSRPGDDGGRAHPGAVRPATGAPA
jgi:UDP:flavonoid glycosyltransferase YjiC (YdhE family)